MTSFPRHKASQILAVGRPAEVVEVPTSSPQQDEILVKVHAWAINPVDHIIRDTGLFTKSWPVTVGYDVAGEVVEIGLDVQSHRVGDRVLVAATAGFQERVIARTISAAKIPSHLTFEKAAVVGLSAATAAAGLYQREYLGLDLPTATPEPKGQQLLVWGAGSSVAASVIQLATASGYEVIATCSPRHFEYTKKLGASKVFDYNSPRTVDDIAEELRNGSLIGAYDAITKTDTQLAIAAILAKVGGGQIVSVLSPLGPDRLPATVVSKTVYAQSIFTPGNPIAEAIFQRFLPQALASGQFVPQPEPDVVGQGLGAIQSAMDIHKAGVSARKIVVRA